MIAEAGTFIPPQRQSRFMIFFMISGEGEQKIGDVSIVIKKNTLLIIPSRVIYSSSRTENTKGYFLLFNFEILSSKTVS